MPEGTKLPEALQALHGTKGFYSGRCSVTPGRGWLAKIALRFAGMPLAGGDTPVRLRVEQEGSAWTWTRDFDSHVTRSQLSLDRGTGCVLEKFGQVSIWLRPVFANERLEIRILRLSFMRFPCPRIFLPHSKTVEWQDEEGRFRFDVSARMPFVGDLIRYEGWLKFDHELTRAD
nr:DUF4166 domain-containing protein [Ruegeria atlantica]